jgi:hypothetical protein
LNFVHKNVYERLPNFFCALLIFYALNVMSHLTEPTFCAGETGRTYEANVDDVGYRLVAIYTPVREDGIEGQPISVSTEQIAVGTIKSPLIPFPIHVHLLFTLSGLITK